MNPKIPVAKSRKEVAEEYGISEWTLYRWFMKANLNIPPGLINPNHLKIIYKTFGIQKTIKLPECPILSGFVRFCPVFFSGYINLITEIYCLKLSCLFNQWKSKTNEPGWQ